MWLFFLLELFSFFVYVSHDFLSVHINEHSPKQVILDCKTSPCVMLKLINFFPRKNTLLEMLLMCNLSKHKNLRNSKIFMEIVHKKLT